MKCKCTEKNLKIEKHTLIFFSYFNLKKTDALDIFSLGRFKIKLRTSIKIRCDCF